MTSRSSSYENIFKLLDGWKVALKVHERDSHDIPTFSRPKDYADMLRSCIKELEEAVIKDFFDREKKYLIKESFMMSDE